MERRGAEGERGWVQRTSRSNIRTAKCSKFLHPTRVGFAAWLRLAFYTAVLRLLASTCLYFEEADTGMVMIIPGIRGPKATRRAFISRAGYLIRTGIECLVAAEHRHPVISQTRRLFLGGGLGDHFQQTVIFAWRTREEQAFHG